MTTTEVSLLDASIQGDRDSFGQIVRNYQSLICSITYNSIGDLHTSEDLAQETFLSAWKNLKQLQDKSKFKYWLCTIARNLTNEYIRQKYRDLTYKSQSLETTANISSTQESPRQEAISKEEENILWESLKEIPEVYREPLILYYRESQSIKSVADALDISEDAAKQRLSRGRNMLKEQVAAFVENTLKKSRPSETFSIAIIAALPTLLPQATATGIALTASKGSTTAKFALSLSFISSLLGPIIGLFCIILGINSGIRNSKSPRERNLLVASIATCVLLFLTFVFALITIFHFSPENRLLEFVSGIAVLYMVAYGALVIWIKQRQKKIQKQDGTYIDLATPQNLRKQKVSRVPLILMAIWAWGFLGILILTSSLTPPIRFFITMGYAIGIIVIQLWMKKRIKKAEQESNPILDPNHPYSIREQQLSKISKRAIYSTYAGSIFGSIGWLIVISFIAKDWITGMSLVSISLLIYGMSTKYCILQPKNYYSILVRVLAGLTPITIFVITIRWADWMVVYKTMGAPTQYVMNPILISILVFSIFILNIFFLDRKDKQLF